MKSIVSRVACMRLFYERAVKRKSIPLCWLTFSAAASPTPSPKLLKPRHHACPAPAARCPLEIHSSDLWPRPLAGGRRPVFYLRLRPPGGLRLLLFQVNAGGHTVKPRPEMRRFAHAAHGTQAHVILPPNLYGISTRSLGGSSCHAAATPRALCRRLHDPPLVKDLPALPHCEHRRRQLARH